MAHPDLVVFYEHPVWFAPLFAALDRSGIAWSALCATGHAFDPSDPVPPAPLVLNRIAMSIFLRQA